MVDQTFRPGEGLIGTANIKVIGCGGGGSNAVSRMYRDRIPEVEYITVNTDSQALSRSDVPVRLRVGDSTARGLGVGGRHRRGDALRDRRGRRGPAIGRGVGSVGEP